MLFIYEYDKPNIFSENALEWSNLLTAGLGMIGNDATRATVSSLASAGLAPLVKALLEGTAKSKIEHTVLLAVMRYGPIKECQQMVQIHLY